MHYIEKINQSSITFVLIPRDDVFGGPFCPPPLVFSVTPIPLRAAGVNALLNMYLGSDGVPLILYIIFLERNIVCLICFPILHL